MKDYKDYTLEDFLSDVEFQEWVLAGADPAQQPWEELKRNAPWQASSMKEAQELIASWRSKDPLITKEKQDLAIRKILMATAHTPLRNTRLRWWRPAKWTAAAILLVTMGLGYLWQQRKATSTPVLAMESVMDGPQMKEIFNQGQVQQEVLLPDKSRVWLMQGAKISYHPSFDGGTRRELKLEGEAFFDVTHDKVHPFSVFTGAIITRVLGTSFRITAASEEVSVVVRSGKVKVIRAQPSLEDDNEVLLLPNQKASYSTQKNKLMRTLSDDPGILTDIGKLPDFNFDNTPLSEVLSRLQKAYGIRIQYDEEIFKNCRLTVPLNGQSFYAKLDIICATTQATYQVDTDGITISGKGCNPTILQNKPIPL